MADPWEGLAPDGTIRTGAGIHRVPTRFRPVLDATVSAVVAAAPGASLSAYGSVVTGEATSPGSDVDLLAIGLDPADAHRIAAQQSQQTGDICRGIEIATVAPSDLHGDSDEAYGTRVFLHHYCVRLAGPDLDSATGAFPGDRRAARGFNGDISDHLGRWEEEAETADPAELGRRVARKTLLAVAGLVSVHDTTWTTDRRRAARRWSEVRPELAVELDRLLAWAAGDLAADRADLDRALDGVVDTVVQQFANDIGLWSTQPR